MVNVLSEITIDKPIKIVADYAADPGNAPEWYENIISAEWKTEKPLKLGSQITFKAAFLGRQLVYTYEIKEFIPGEKLIMQTAEGPFPMETTYTWEKVDNNKTRMTLRNAGQPSGFSNLLAPLIAVMVRKANKNDLKKIKSILENK